jgi:2-polyprenyl-3-methyl-5-hydroxy-6-metoxy-1,4-benzoquinol methylase
MSEKNDIINFYECKCDEDGRLSSTRMSSVEFLTTMKYLKDICPSKSEILDACAGTGAYAFPLAEMGHNVTAGDLVEYSL